MTKTETQASPRVRGIVCSAEEVRGLLAGTLAELRRADKMRGADRVRWHVGETHAWKGKPGERYEGWVAEVDGLALLLPLSCPFGQPGDWLWCRETWEQVHPCQARDGRYSQPGHAGIPGPPPAEYRVIYRADGEYPRVHFQRGEGVHPWREVCPGDACTRSHEHPEEAWHGWSSPMHMPRWASRLTLEIQRVGVERTGDRWEWRIGVKRL